MTLIGVIAEELEIGLEGVGSTTFRREDLARGFEPDACYYLTKAEYIRHKDDIDLAVDPPPELVIEIDITSPSLNKFSILASWACWKCGALIALRLAYFASARASMSR
jgi:Uma2 family endonuclease